MLPSPQLKYELKELFGDRNINCSGNNNIGGIYTSSWRYKVTLEIIFNQKKGGFCCLTRNEVKINFSCLEYITFNVSYKSVSKRAHDVQVNLLMIDQSQQQIQ